MRKKVTREKRIEYLQRHYERHPENKAAKAKLNRDWIINNRERYNQLKSNYRFRLKIAALEYYSQGTPKCAHCGFSSDIDALILDHINDDGNAHRKEMGCTGRGLPTGTNIYERLKAKGWMPGLQVLCANCNTIKAIRLRRGNTSTEMAVIVGTKSRWRKKSDSLVNTNIPTPLFF